MKTTIHTRSKTRTIGFLLLAGLATGYTISARAQAEDPNAHPMCGRFVVPDSGASPLIWNDAKGKYCGAEADVLCGSAGKGFVLATTEASKSSRKAWIDLKNAVQLDGTTVAVSTLPQGEIEMVLNHTRPNTAAGDCLDDFTTVYNPLQMVPGQTFTYGLLIRFWDQGKTASKGEYDLRFGQPICADPWRPGPYQSSGCPVVVTAGDDLDGDGFADVFTMEPDPSQPVPRALLLKVVKGKLVVVGMFAVSFKLLLTREQFGSYLN